MRSQQVMEWTPVYRAWIAPFADAKLSPLLKNNDLTRVRRVLDVGCGPGTDTHLFAHCNYLGVDRNRSNIESARRRFNRNFVIADVTAYEVPAGERFDFVLANSLLHHIDDAGVHTLLSRLSTLMADDGHVHIIDLVLPEERGLPRLMARMDRGDYPRRLERWNEIFTQHFEPLLLESFPVGLGGVAIWNMLYFKGKRKS